MNATRIATVTLNPAIDQTVRVDQFQTNMVNRAQTMRFDAGGKGVNVASFLADSGFDVAVTGLLGEENADIFERFFSRKHIDDQFVRLPGSTRIGVKIVDEANQQTTDINMPGLHASPEAETALMQKIDELAKTCEWFALAGTLPPGLPASTYATIIARLKEAGRKVALDTSGEALRLGIQAGPTIVKPNIDELQQLVGRTLTGEAAIEQAARQLLDTVQDIQLVVISMGERGALFVNRDTSLVAFPPTVNVKSTVGAGDAMIAGIIAGQIQQLSLPDCARLATAFSVGTITRFGTDLPDAETLRGFGQQVSLHNSIGVPRSA